MQNLEQRKIAVILPPCSTGGIKYFCLLIKSIIKLRPNYQIKIWKDMKDSYCKSLIDEELANLGIEAKNFDSRIFIEKKKSNIKFLNNAINKFRRLLRSKSTINSRILDTFDLVFCPWPYDYNCPDTNAPIVCVPHDFNYTHHFGMNTYGYEAALRMKNQHSIWFEKSTPVVSTNFMADELKKAFPDFQGDVEVAHLTKLNDFQKLEESRVDEILAENGIKFDYVLCANNTCYHKNFNILYSGYYHLKQKYPNIKLVLIGHGTESFRGKSNSPQYIDVFNKDPDILGYGLVPDEVLVALMQRAKAVVNSSLYEAGNGSGLDAWGLGAPVVMSDIIPFREQIEVLGVKAQLFDPQNGKDLADAIIRVLDNPEQTKKEIILSEEAIKNYSWDKVAQKYIDIFEKKFEGDHK